MKNVISLALGWYCGSCTTWTDHGKAYHLRGYIQLMIYSFSSVFLFLLCISLKQIIIFTFDQVVYSVAHEGSRLEVPEGPLGRLISGPTTCLNHILMTICTHLVQLNHFFSILFTDCWADAHERPSCDEILSRLVDMEYSSCWHNLIAFVHRELYLGRVFTVLFIGYCKFCSQNIPKYKLMMLLLSLPMCWKLISIWSNERRVNLIHLVYFLSHEKK